MNNIQIDLAIIGGTGLYELEGFEEVERVRLLTQWGQPSSEIIIMKSGAKHVAFLARHGLNHTIPPHKVNYRANMWALKECGVKKVIAVAAVGGITENMSPETIVIPDQIIDYTYSRKQTFFETDNEPVVHIDFTEPYSSELRKTLLNSAKAASIDIVDGGVYAATQGPRLETAAEVQKLKQDGADIVGMTGMPEATLAREIELDYACCALVVNWGAGCAGTHKIDHSEMQGIVDKGMLKVKALIQQCF